MLQLFQHFTLTQGLLRFLVSSLAASGCRRQSTSLSLVMEERACLSYYRPRDRDFTPASWGTRTWL